MVKISAYKSKAEHKRPVSMGDRIVEVFVSIIVFIGVVLTVIPFMHIISLSLSMPDAIMMGKVWLWPMGFNAEAYLAVFRDAAMIHSLLYTIFLTAVYTLGAMLMTVCLAYPLSKSRLKGRKIFTLVVIITMYFSGGIIPDYILMRTLNINNTSWSLIFPTIISAYNMIILKSFFMSLPTSIEESASLDGASDFCILTRIILPLSKPVLATLCLFYAVQRWNTFQDVLYYITDSSLYTIQLKLNMLINLTQSSELTQFEGAKLENLVTENIKSASIMFATIPIILVYPWLQKYFVSGITLGAVKG